jgi:hypothetical protein
MNSREQIPSPLYVYSAKGTWILSSRSLGMALLSTAQQLVSNLVQMCHKVQIMFTGKQCKPIIYICGNSQISEGVDSIGFWRWCITHRITGFSDFVHRPDSKQLQEKHDVSETGSVSVLRWGEIPTLLGPLEKANLDHWYYYWSCIMGWEIKFIFPVVEVRPCRWIYGSLCSQCVSASYKSTPHTEGRFENQSK